MLTYHEEEEKATAFFRCLAEGKAQDQKEHLVKVPIKDIYEDFGLTAKFMKRELLDSDLKENSPAKNGPRQYKQIIDAKMPIEVKAKMKELHKKEGEEDGPHMNMPQQLATLIQHRKTHRVRFISMMPNSSSKFYSVLPNAEVARKTLDAVSHAYHHYLGKYANQTLVDNTASYDGQGIGPRWLPSSQMLVFLVPVIGNERSMDEGTARVLLDLDKLAEMVDKHKEHVQQFERREIEGYKFGKTDANYELLAMQLNLIYPPPAMLLGVNLYSSDKWEQHPYLNSATDYKLPGGRTLPLRYFYTSTAFQFDMKTQPPYERGNVLHLPFKIENSSEARALHAEKQQELNTQAFRAIGTIQSSIQTSKSKSIPRSKSKSKSTNSSSTYMACGYKHESKRHPQQQQQRVTVSCKYCNDRMPEGYWGCAYCSG